MRHKTKVILKKAIDQINRSVLSNFSLRITTLRTPNRDFRQFFEHLKELDFTPSTIIDIGVGNGTPSLYANNEDADFVLIEPIPDDAGSLSALASSLNADLHNVAAGSNDGELTFNLHKDKTGSSAYDQVEGNDAVGCEQITVPVRRLDTLLKDREIKRPAVLKIDTQGAELEVLTGAAGVLDQIDVVIVEVSFHEFREGIPEIADTILAFKKRGFVPYEILEGHYRYADNALAQVDVVFVPESSVLRAFKGFFTPSQLDAYNAGRL